MKSEKEAESVIKVLDEVVSNYTKTSFLDVDKALKKLEEMKNTEKV